ncbi:MAG TPA: hypothetical protein VFT37_08235 [Telluria sp.]|nr:hypothetical protein [Telluria sp.]
MKRLILAAAASLALSACSGGLLRADDASTQAVRMAMAAQVIDHAGVRDTSQVVGLDGRAAVNAQERYQKSFGGSKPLASPVATTEEGAWK